MVWASCLLRVLRTWKVMTGKSFTSKHEEKLQTRVWANHYGFKKNPAADKRNSLHVTILHLIPSIHKQISYFTVSMTTTDISCMFFKEGKVKITLGVKLNISPSPHLFYSQTVSRHSNLTFLSEIQCLFLL